MKKECVQIVFSAEISRKIAMYKSHYIQYTLFAFLIVLGYVYGLVAKMDTSQVSGFERLTVLYVVYYIVIIRLFSTSFVNVYNEFHKGFYLKEVLYNETLTHYNGVRIVMVRAITNSLCSAFVTYMCIICITVFMGMNFSYSNYLIILIKLLIGSVMLWGMALIYCSFCLLFDIQKEIALFGELIVIIVMIILPLEWEYIPTNIIKTGIYSALLDDIVLCRVSKLISSSDIIMIISSLILLIVAYFGYRMSEWKKMKRGIILK